MKNLVFISICLFCYVTTVYGQIKRNTISESKIGGVSTKYFKSINIESNDTIYYVHLKFQNLKYKSISDIIILDIKNQDEKNELVQDLKSAVIEVEKKVEMFWLRESYAILVFDYSNKMMLSEPPKKGKGFTALTKKQAEQLILWLESFEFGKG